MSKDFDKRPLKEGDAVYADSFIIEEIISEVISPAKGLDIQLAGICARYKDQIVVGSAACTTSDPSSRATYELIERIHLIQSSREEATFRIRSRSGNTSGKLITADQLFPTSSNPSLWQYSKSNGVALHNNWYNACESALFELIERHIFLSAWFGDRSIIASDEKIGRPIQKLHDIYTTRAISFGCQTVSIEESPDCTVHCQGIFLLPKTSEHPFVFGLGAHSNAQKALEKAEKEALARLGFLWQEIPSSSIPSFSPTPMYHQEYYLVPKHLEIIKQWLDGPKNSTRNPQQSEKPLFVNFADLGRPNTAEEYRIARAYSSEVIPLVFGRYPFEAFHANIDDKGQTFLHPVA